MKHFIRFNKFTFLSKQFAGGMFCLFFLLAATNQSYATHASGADLTYRCLGGLVYEIEATFYRDCGGSAEPNTVTINYKSILCAYNRNVVATKVISGNGNEITLPCVSAPSTCNGGMSTGIRKWVYRATVTLPIACSDWVFSYHVCCRNCTITTIQQPCASGSEIYVEAKLDNVAAPGNSSPVFNNTPVAFVCLGQSFNYNQGVYDIDGDSLSYELIVPKTSATGTITWLAPATTQAPIHSSTPFVLNPVTGDIQFTPSAMQIGVLAIRVNEFRDGQLIGSTIRDMQVYTVNCTNTIPVASGINGTSSYLATACAGQQLCFTISAIDVDANQVISFTSFNPISGSSLVAGNGSVPSLEFCWTPSISDAGPSPHIFTITIKDNACPVNGVQTFSYAIYVNAPVVTVTSVNPLCSGSNNGSATATMNGPGTYNYSWNTTPVQNSSTATGLHSGNYTVTVTDISGCSTSATTSLVDPPASMSVNAVSTGVINCQSGNIGSVQANLTGGQTPYNYVWSNGASTPTISNLAAGMYTVTVIDAMGCSSTDTAYIASAIGSINTQATVAHHVSCFGGSNGSVVLNVSGGTAPYIYNWSNSSTSNQLNGIQAGIYSVTVSDVNGCSGNTSVTVLQPQTPLSANGACTNITCFGNATGAIDLQVSGGTSPYNYNWTNNITSQDLSGISSGAYQVTITDSEGCTTVQSFTISQPVSPILPTAIVSHAVNCFGAEDGEIQITTNGGQYPYTFLWSNGETVPQVNQLSAGIYSITITDANQCDTSIQVTVTQPAAPLLALTTITNHVSCRGGADGIIDLTVNGGTAPYNFLWSTGSQSENANNLSAGLHTCTITDANGCASNISAEIFQPTQSLTTVLNPIQVLCHSGNSGTIQAVASGGTAPYSYLWSNGNSGTGISGLTAGNYSVTITDAKNCISEASVEVLQPATVLNTTIENVQHVKCKDNYDGKIKIHADGGTGPYSYMWNQGSMTTELNDLAAGVYTVTATDANGCTVMISQEITEPESGVLSSITLEHLISCFGGNDGKLNAVAFGGTAPYTYVWNTGVTTGILDGLAAGTYEVTVTDMNGCTYHTEQTISQPATQVMITAQVENANCLNGNTGSIQLQISGGDPEYTVHWNHGSSALQLTNLAPGNYSVLITDSKGCTAADDYSVNGSSAVQITASGNTTICVGETITLEADSFPGGTYQWYYDGDTLDGATARQFVTPAAGLYSVSVNSVCGTFKSDSIEVLVKSIGNVGVSNTQIICPPETAQLIATGGNTYEWHPATYITFTNVPDPVVSPLKTVVYSVEITNEFGCKTTLKTEVAVVCDSLLVPTGFSPNDDGTNDGYVIDGIENYPGNKLWVYNRYGKLVYKATDYNNSWNGIGNITGISSGSKVPSGTYYYILDLNDQSKPRAGYLIIRH